MVDGFRASKIRWRLQANGVSVDDEIKGKSLALLESLLSSHGLMGFGEKLDGLREAQHIRTKLSAHYGGTAATEISRSAVEKHSSYREHFRAICRRVVDELDLIGQALALTWILLFLMPVSALSRRGTWSD